MANSAFPAPNHDHARCLKAAIQRARDAFKRHRLSLTPLREVIFWQIAASHRPIGAYEVREKLKANGRHLSPMSIYRIIEVFIEAGVVRRFETGNAFYASASGDPTLPRIVLACRHCGCVADADGTVAFGAIARIAAAHAFAPMSAVIEVLGTCRNCAKTTESTAGP
jgi:Fur family transcriptional regulator, zinc uptake regulator